MLNGPPRFGRMYVALSVSALCACGAAPAQDPQSPPPASASVVLPPEPEAEPADASLESDSEAALEAPERSAPSSRGWLGVELSATQPGEAGVLVRAVVPDSPAAAAGLIAGDVILTLDGENVDQPAQVVQKVTAHAAGERLAVGIQRGGTQKRLFAVKLGAVPDDEGIMRMTYAGKPAPAWGVLKTVQGHVEPSVSALKGKVVVIEFWAPWCAACRYLVPTINDWHARFTPQGAKVLGVTMDPVLDASEAAAQLDMRYPLASDINGETTLAYRGRALPTLFVIDKKGTVRDVVVGYSSARMQEIEALIERLLQEN